MSAAEWNAAQESRLREVETKLAAHEAVCAERYAGIRSDLQDFKRLINKVGGAIIIGMATILAKLIFLP